MEASGIAEGVPPAATGLEPEPELEPAPIQLEPEPEPHAQPHAQPEPELAPEPEPEPEQEHELQSGELQRCASRQLPAGWEAHTSQRTGETYFLNVVSYESTWERPVSAALPEGWSHNRVTQTGEVYFVAPSGESTFELPLDLAQSQYQEEEDGEEESSGGTDQEPRSEQQSRTQWLRRKTQQLVDWSDKKQRERDAAKAAAQAQLAALDAVAIEGFPRQIPSEHELPKTVTVNEHECTLVNFEQLSYSAWICDVCLRNQGKGGTFFHDGPIGTPNDNGFDCCVRCAQKHGALGEEMAAGCGGIDAWLMTNPTCPTCRAPALPKATAEAAPGGAGGESQMQAAEAAEAEAQPRMPLAGDAGEPHQGIQILRVAPGPPPQLHQAGTQTSEVLVGGAAAADEATPMQLGAIDVD